MKYHNITKCDMNNGDGIRVVLWVSGCTHKCPGCQNPCTWDIDSGEIFGEEAKAEIFEELSKDYIQGITFSGGDPLHPGNREEIGKLIREIVNKFPEKDIWCYTGFTFEELKRQSLPFLRDIDVLVDGRYVEAVRDITLEWRGSSNQRVIKVKESLLCNEIIEL